MSSAAGLVRRLVAQRGLPWRFRFWLRRQRERFPAAGDLSEALTTAWASVLFYSGVLYLPPLRGRTAGAVILAYHGVGDRAFLPDGMVLAPARFEAHLRYLCRHRIVAPLETIVGFVERGETPPRDTVAITFDDGYANNYVVALPLLRKYRCHGTVFVTTGSLEKRQSLWPLKLFYWLHLTSSRTLHLEGVPGRPTLTFDVGSPRGRRRAAQALPWLLRHMPTEKREEAQRRIANDLGVDPTQDPRELVPMLTWDQVRALAAAGISIGAHTQSHPALSATTPEEAGEEVVESKVAVERELGQQVSVFAYPFGRREDIGTVGEQAVRGAGFRAACCTVPGLNRAGTNLWALHRIVVKNWSVARLALELLRAGRAHPA